jgi:hypothetical protein
MRAASARSSLVSAMNRNTPRHLCIRAFCSLVYRV